MNIKPEKLSEEGYKLLDELGHKELVPFIQTYLKKKTRFSILYYLSNILAFLLVLYFLLVDYSSVKIDFWDRFIYFANGLALAFLLIPLHEYIHGLAYKSQGALNTSYDANLRKFYFMAIADRFVANRKEFQVVALAPFMTINLILIALLFPANPMWKLSFSGILLTHITFCSGDFGLLSYFDFHKGKEVVTYDDKGKGISYFFAKIKT